MTDRIGRAAAVGLLWMVSCASLVRAQDAGAPPLDGGVQTPDAGDAATANSSVLALAVGPNVVDRDALRVALEAELGVDVEDAGSAPAYMPTLSVVLLPNGNVEVALSSRTVPRSTREFLLSAQLPAERVEMVTLIAANLIRNEAAALLPELRPAPPPPPAPAAAPVTQSTPAKLVDPCAVSPPREFGIDLAPGVGASSNPRGRTATRAFSLGFAGSLYDRLQGFELSWTGANIVRKSVCGAQVSGLGANVSWGPVVGAQAGLFNLVKGTMRGAQLGIADVTIGDFRGAQAGVVTINHGRMAGAQLAVATYARHGLKGVQGGVLNLSLGDTTGAQLAVANYAGGALRGLQAGTLNIVTGDVVGAQLGVANFTFGVNSEKRPAGSKPEWKGAQLGVLNVSGAEVRGVQLGVVNYAERSNASLGLLSIVRRGRTSIDLSGTVDSSLVFASVTHGGKYIHNILGVGVRANPGDTRLATQFGIGVRALSNRWLRLDVDLLTQDVYSNNLKTKGTSMVATVRVPVTVMLVRGLGVMAAPSYNFSIIDVDETRTLNNFGSTSVHRGDPNVRGWPGLTLGVRYEFDHGG